MSPFTSAVAVKRGDTARLTATASPSQDHLTVNCTLHEKSVATCANCHGLHPASHTGYVSYHARLAALGNASRARRGEAAPLPRQRRYVPAPPPTRTACTIATGSPRSTATASGRAVQRSTRECRLATRTPPMVPRHQQATPSPSHPTCHICYCLHLNYLHKYTTGKVTSFYAMYGYNYTIRES